jgi:hypothetical protein
MDLAVTDAVGASDVNALHRLHPQVLDVLQGTISPWGAL